MLLAVRIVRYAEISLSVDIEVDECGDIETKVRYLRSMSEELQIEFQKWEGTGNTFVIIDGFKYAGFDLQSLDSKVITRICEQENTDGVIVLEASELPHVDLKCDYRNADGSRSFCGNGTRASFLYAKKQGWVLDEAIFEACDGLHKVKLNKDLDFPSVKFMPLSSPVEIDHDDFRGDLFINTGSPHHIHVVHDKQTLDEFDLEAFGRSVRHHKRYAPEGTNVNVLCDLGEDLFLRTYERGVEGETQACGTGAVAAALVHFTLNGGETQRKVTMPGGELFVRFEASKGGGGYNGVWLSGKASEMVRGILKVVTVLLLMLGLSPFSSQAQWYDNLSEETTVSVITLSPGLDTYSAFGHTAIRIYDPLEVPVVDWVFNYGTFSFDDGFYLNFMRGRLNYKLTAAPFYLFKGAYVESGRGMFEQRLNLNASEVRDVAAYLSWNLQEENAVYRYEFFRDNCASRVIVVLEAALGDKLNTHCHADGRTFRDGLGPYIEGSPWTSLGMDFILGPRADAVMTECGASFIPDDLAKALTRMTVNDVPLTSENDREDHLIVEGMWFAGEPEGAPKRHVPLIVAVFFVGLMGFLKMNKAVKAGKSDHASHTMYNVVRFFIAGAATTLGILLLSMWVLTDHSDTWGNYNLLWTLPAFVVFLPQSLRFKNKTIAAATAVVAAYLLLSPWLLPQFTSLSLWCAALSVFLAVSPLRCIPTNTRL
jgi:diaminopimelate epimerase